MYKAIDHLQGVFTPNQVSDATIVQLPLRCFFQPTPRTKHWILSQPKLRAHKVFISYIDNRLQEIQANHPPHYEERVVRRVNKAINDEDIVIQPSMLNSRIRDVLINLLSNSSF